MAYLANQKVKRDLFPEGSLSYQALGIHHRQPGEQSTLRAVLTALTLLSTPRRADCSHQIQARGSCKGQPAPSPAQRAAPRYTHPCSSGSDLRNRQHIAPGPPGLADGVTQHERIWSTGWLLLLCTAIKARKVSGAGADSWTSGLASVTGRKLICTV